MTFKELQQLSKELRENPDKDISDLHLSEYMEKLLRQVSFIS